MSERDILSYENQIVGKVLHYLGHGSLLVYFLWLSEILFGSSKIASLQKAGN